MNRLRAFAALFFLPVVLSHACYALGFKSASHVWSPQAVAACVLLFALPIGSARLCFYLGKSSEKKVNP